MLIWLVSQVKVVDLIGERTCFASVEVVEVTSTIFTDSAFLRGPANMIFEAPVNRIL